MCNGPMGSTRVPSLKDKNASLRFKAVSFVDKGKGVMIEEAKEIDPSMQFVLLRVMIFSMKIGGCYWKS